MHIFYGFIGQGYYYCHSVVNMTFYVQFLVVYCTVLDILKGLGHAILGNFSTYQMVIELTKI